MTVRRGFFELGEVKLEYEWIGPGPDEAPTLVLLHEGLGSVSTWRGFPGALAERTGCGVLAYSRRGYGKSSPCEVPRPLGYMQREGRHSVSRVLEEAGVRDAILVGHSDGASIAIVYAGSEPRPGLLGLVLLAPHVFCEELSVRSIAAAREAYENGDLRAKLEKHHGKNVDCAFWGWNRAWLDPAFRTWNLEPFLPGIRVPALVLQGADDEYGTLAQVESIRTKVRGPCEVAILEACGHSPQRDQPEATLAHIAGFVESVMPRAKAR